MVDNPLFSRHIGSNDGNRLFSSTIDHDATLPFEHPRLSKLPDWPDDTIAVLCTEPGPHVIPVTAPLRAADRRILLSLKRGRGSLERLRHNAQVALLILEKGDLAFAARGKGTVVQEAMVHDPEFAAVSIDVEVIDDHRLKDRKVTSGVGWDSTSEANMRFLRAHLGALREIAADMMKMAQQRATQVSDSQVSAAL